MFVLVLSLRFCSAFCLPLGFTNSGIAREVDLPGMRSTSAALLLAASTAIVCAQSSYGGNNSTPSPFPPFSGDPFKKYSLSAKGINASFIPYGARLTNLYVYDKSGQSQDVAVGYDEGTRYLQDSETNHTYFGAVVGRYANR